MAHPGALPATSRLPPIPGREGPALVVGIPPQNPSRGSLRDSGSGSERERGRSWGCAREPQRGQELALGPCHPSRGLQLPSPLDSCWNPSLAVPGETPRALPAVPIVRLPSEPPPGRAPLGREEPDADGSPRGMSFPGWMSWKSCLAAAPSSLWGSPLPVSRCPACGCPLHVVSWLRAALPPRSSPLPGSLPGPFPSLSLPARETGAFLPQGLLGPGIAPAAPSPPGGVTGCPEGSGEGEVGSVGTWGLKWQRPPCQDLGEPSPALRLSRIFPARTGPRGGLGGPPGQGGTGGDFPRCQQGGGSCFQVPKAGVVAPKESFPGVLPLLFCLIRRIHSRVPLPGAVSSVWNKR